MNMVTQDFSLCKTLNPKFSLLHCSSLSPFSNPLRKTLTFPPQNAPKPSHFPTIPAILASGGKSRDLRSYAGRSKKKPPGPGGGSSSGGRIEGNAEFRREVKRNARRRNKKMAESLFYRLKNPNRNHPDNFTEDELQEIGLGYDRLVRFMDKDDPNLRNPNDWYKYGEFGPYSWRGVVLGDPVRGRFSDERVAMISEVRDAEEWEKIEKSEMGQKFGKRLEQMDRKKFKYFWVFVRHPRWRLSELPWQQWTLVCEVVVENGFDQRLDKWNLMGRLGNMTRSMITKCAAWFRPDIIYVKRPVYQCRFEPQDNFFKVLMPFLDPKTEKDCLFELEKDDGSVELCTYYGGLCKILKVSQKVGYVDDVVKAYEKLSDEDKSKCLEFLLKNHPMPLLHPYTKEWKAKLEEIELGCDAPDDDESDMRVGGGSGEIVDWIEEEEEEEDEVVVDEEEEDSEEEDEDEEGDDKYWEDEFKKALTSSEGMENLVKRSVELSNERYKEHLGAAMDMDDEDGDDDGGGDGDGDGDGDEIEMRGKRAKVSPEEWKIVGIGPWRKRIKKSRIPPELFLRAAVRPFTYRNLVKEIVLTRHGILDGDISSTDNLL
ncbi:hypothetical protein CsatB_000138 [Cannabis sativa]